MKILKFNEMSSNNYDFHIGTYDESNKSIIAAYMVTSENDRSLTVLNIQEVVDDSKIFGHKKAYYIKPSYTTLPKSEITILGDVDGKEGFQWMKIPYGLYVGTENLKIKRIKIGKVLTLMKFQINNNFSDKLNDPNIEKYFKQIAFDQNDFEKFKWMQRSIKQELIGKK